MEANCINCGTFANDHFCSNCGHNQELKRIDKNYAFQELSKLVGFEKGFIFTSKELLLHPGAVIREYIHTNRQKITKPLTYLILASVIYTLISQYFKLDVVHSDFSKKFYGNSSLGNINNWVQNNYGYANIIMILPITLWTKLFFKEYKYNFYETFVVISLVMGFGMLIFSLEPIIDRLFPSYFILINGLVGFISFIYASWGIGQFYGKSVSNYLKAFLSYFLGFITFQFVISFIAIVYDVFLKK